MAQPIKYREWDPGRQSRYKQGMSYAIREEYTDMTGFRFAHEEDLDYFSRLTQSDKNNIPYRRLMAAIGIFDHINQKDIYDLDIVVRHHFALPDLIGVVAHSEISPGYILRTANEEHTLYLHQPAMQYEVIGNLFETPQLRPKGLLIKDILAL